MCAVGIQHIRQRVHSEVQNAVLCAHAYHVMREVWSSFLNTDADNVQTGPISLGHIGQKSSIRRHATKETLIFVHK